jgi:hypothetical protein
MTQKVLNIHVADPLVVLLSIFSAAKVFGFSNMSWIWVLSPVWIPLLILIVLTVVMSLVYGIVVARKKKALPESAAIPPTT